MRIRWRVASAVRATVPGPWLPRASDGSLAGGDAAKMAVQRMQVNILDGKVPAVMAVQLSPSRGLADMNPVVQLAAL